MKTIIVLISWAKMNGSNMAAFARKIVQKLTGNSKFSSPSVSLKAIGDAADRCESAHSNRKNGEEGKLENEAAIEALSAMLYATASYVNTVAKGDATIIASSGFDASSNTRVPATTPVAPAQVKVKPQVGGILNLSVDKVAGADSYVYVLYTTENFVECRLIDNQIRVPQNEGEVIIITDGSTREDVRGLIPGTKVFVQALAQNAAGKSPFSPIVRTFIV